MSYIRCLSNPEALYIIGLATNNGRHSGRVEFCDGEGLSLPRHAFEGVLKRWYEGEQESARYRGATITETKDFKYEFRYKDWPHGFTMWKVTLMYICTQNQFRWAK